MVKYVIEIMKEGNQMDVNIFSKEEMHIISQTILKIKQDRNVTESEAVKIIISYGIQAYQEIENIGKTKEE